LGYQTGKIKRTSPRHVIVKNTGNTEQGKNIESCKGKGTSHIYKENPSEQQISQQKL
jgi:hypothetical protein